MIWKKNKVNFGKLPKTNEEYISVRYGCKIFIDSYRFLSSSLDHLLKNFDEDDFIIFKKEFPDNRNLLNKKLAHPYEFFDEIEDYEKPVDNLKKQYFFSRLKNKCPDDNEIERTKQIVKIFKIKKGELASLYMKTDISLLAGVYEKFIKVFTKDYGTNP